MAQAAERGTEQIPKHQQDPSNISSGWEFTAQALGHVQVLWP